jgi:signal transduction histidine kinase
MDQAKIVITGAGSTQEVELTAHELVLGRAETCDVVLSEESISRRHARISQDPFGRWILEDLGSQNGIMIDGQRVQAQALVPQQQVELGRFSLEYVVASDPELAPTTSVVATLNIMDEAVVSFGDDKAASLSPLLVQHLNELSGSLMRVARPADLYAQACQCLAGLLNTLVAVVRLPRGEVPLPKSPEILACSFGQDSPSEPMLQSSHLHLSRRTLDAVRSTDAPVMATSGGSAEGQNMHLTIVDDQEPHVVFAVCVNIDEPGQIVEVLYVDMFESQTSEATLDFIEVVARHINLAQKHLLFAELQKQEQALRLANAQLNEKDRIKDEYVSRITHDIKGHLFAIANCLYVAASDLPEDDDSNAAKFVVRAQARTDRCSAFVIDLLNLTRMRLGGTIEMKAFSLPDCLGKVIEDNAERAQDKSIELTCQVEPAVDKVIGNELSLHEVLGNLVSNAVKYSPEGRQATVRVTALDQAVQVEVADTGIGIPQADVEHVFDEFFRASNAVSGKEEGTGLGLSIVKQIVDSHNGNIRATSQEGQGTTFTLVLPLDCRSSQ